MRLPERGESYRTNEFHFTFRVPSPHSVPRVVPETYIQVMKFLQAKRRFEAASAARAQPPHQRFQAALLEQ